MKHEWTAESLLELGRSYQQSQPLLAAAEIGLFEALGEREQTAGDLAAELSTDRRATTYLLDALVAQGVLRKEGDRYAIPSRLAPLLIGSDATSVLPMIRHHATCAQRWSALAEVVRSGRPAVDSTGAPRSAVELRAFLQAMHVVGREVAPGIVAALRPERFRRALDVGGASGTYTLALLHAVPAMRVTLFDRPEVIGMARERLEREGLLDRVDLAGGDFYTDPLPSGHDLVLLSAIVHQNGPAENRALFAKCRAALHPGGSVVIRDILMDPDHTRPPGGALFALNMLVATEEGGSYSFEQLRDDLHAAGFVGIELIQRGTWMDGLIEARRPE
jgi:predicted O-methyltransferase YrrM